MQIQVLDFAGCGLRHICSSFLQISSVGVVLEVMSVWSSPALCVVDVSWKFAQLLIPSILLHRFLPCVSLWAVRVLSVEEDTNGSVPCLVSGGVIALSFVLVLGFSVTCLCCSYILLDNVCLRIVFQSFCFSNIVSLLLGLCLPDPWGFVFIGL